MKLSIIVPVYNVEKYIVKCISSLLDQNYDDYEIIIVDDGSPDNSIEVLNNSVQSEKTRIIRQDNQGLSGARNTGINEAKGEYVWFFDSDDFIERNVLQEICVLLDGIDILALSDHNEIYEGDDTISRRCYQIDSECIYASSFPHCAPYYIFRKDFLKTYNLYFYPGIYHEDSLFTPQAMYWANDFKVYNRPVYQRLNHEGSITHSINEKKVRDLSFVIKSLLTFAQEKVSPRDYDKWTLFIGSLIMEILQQSRMCGDNTKPLVDNLLEGNNRNEFLSILSSSRSLPIRLFSKLCILTGGNIYNLHKVYYFIRYKIF